MEKAIKELKNVAREVLGDIASQILLGKIDAALDEGSASGETLLQACVKIEKMVNLFIGTDKAQVINKRFREALTRSGIKTA